jgi:spore coat protein A, manganese oxidase
MILTRRKLLQLGGAGLTQGMLSGIWGCDLGKPLPRLLESKIQLPPKFKVELPRIPTLSPIERTDTEDRYELSAKVSTSEILSGYRTPIWGFGGSFPGPTIEAQRGRRVTVNLTNDLPVPIVKHLHGGRTPASSDGYPTDLLLPRGGWSVAHSHDPVAQISKGSRTYVYPNEQRAATLWYHDHRMDFTGPQIWRGLAGFYIVRDETEAGLGLPSKDKEVALMICDRSFGADGSFLYPAIEPELIDQPGVTHPYMGGVLGDVMLTNGVPWPRMEVSNTRYRLRILNACNARRITLAIDGKEKGVRQIIQIGSDGGLLGQPVVHSCLPIAPAERFDVILDFSGCRIGERVVLRNLDGDGPTSDVMCFDVVRSEVDHSEIPRQLCEFEHLDPRAIAATRQFDFSYGGMEKGWMINGMPFDPARADASPRLNDTELWHLHSDRSHPLHFHLAQFQVIAHAGKPRSWDAGWKDTISMHAGQVASILIRFSGYKGRYVFHCHNLEHEDMAMMGNFNVI